MNTSVSTIISRIWCSAVIFFNDTATTEIYTLSLHDALPIYVGVIALLVDAAAIISQKALLKCSYAPYARVMKKICWEESFHILHGRDVILTMMNGTDEQRELVQEAVTRWWGPRMPFHGNPIPADE